jgi:hypothetical protein
LVLDVEHPGDVGAGEVDIENTDFVAAPCEGKRKLDCYGGFADTAFSGENLWAGE